MSNSSLVDLATRQPTTREELFSITGIGEKKVELYGDEIIKIILEYNCIHH
jgi:superfamily II DNA helicase RecQ